LQSPKSKQEGKSNDRVEEGDARANGCPKSKPFVTLQKKEIKGKLGLDHEKSDAVKALGGKKTGELLEGSA